MASPWKEAADPSTGRTYYYNTDSGLTQWEAPPPPPAPPPRAPPPPSLPGPPPLLLPDKKELELELITSKSALAAQPPQTSSSAANSAGIDASDPSTWPAAAPDTVEDGKTKKTDDKTDETDETDETDPSNWIVDSLREKGMARCCCRDCCCGAGEGCCISEETTTLGPVFYAAWSLVALACFVGNLIYPVENMCGFVARPVAVMWSYSVWSIPAAAFVISVVCLLFYGLFYGLLFFVCCCRKPTKCNIGDAGLYLAFFALVVFVWLTVVFPISFVFFPSFMVYVVFSSGGGGVEYLPLLCISFAILVFFWPMVVELLGSNFKNLSKSPNPVFHACRQCGIAPECFPQRKDKIRKVRRCRLCVLACILLLHIASGLAAAYVGLVKDAADGCRNCNNFVASQVTTTAATSYHIVAAVIQSCRPQRRSGTVLWKIITQTWLITHH